MGWGLLHTEPGGSTHPSPNFTLFITCPPSLFLPLSVYFNPAFVNSTANTRRREAQMGVKESEGRS